jgi:CBS domain-containing protein
MTADDVMTPSPLTVTPEATVAEVWDLMSSDVIAVSPETELDEIIELLVEHRIGAVPMVRSDTSEVIGVVSYVDVLQARHASLER